MAEITTMSFDLADNYVEFITTFADPSGGKPIIKKNYFSQRGSYYNRRFMNLTKPTELTDFEIVIRDNGSRLYITTLFIDQGNVLVGGEPTSVDGLENFLNKYTAK